MSANESVQYFQPSAEFVKQATISGMDAYKALCDEMCIRDRYNGFTNSGTTIYAFYFTCVLFFYHLHTHPVAVVCTEQQQIVASCQMAHVQFCSCLLYTSRCV